jgi:hypothetical protein
MLLGSPALYLRKDQRDVFQKNYLSTIDYIFPLGHTDGGKPLAEYTSSFLL